MKSVMNHKFSDVPNVSVPRSSFDRSHGYKTTFDAGDLVPFFCDEALPGDSFNLDATLMARLNTPIFPIMDNMFLDTFFFAVPYRLLWDNWKKFNGEQANPSDSIDYTIPTMTSPPTTGYSESSLSDYFGIPPGVPNVVHSSLFHRAYNLCYNEWFRDQNLIDSVVVDKDDGPDNPSDYVILKRGKRHDYFTSCLPWPQKGDAVSLPLGISAPIMGIGLAANQYAAGNVNIRETDSSSQPVITGWISDPTPAGTPYNKVAIEEDPNNLTFPNIRADLTNATAATINQLREAFQVQKILEKDARAGTRYIELIKSHFGVTSPDARLQRPEYLGGSSTPISITPVTQQSESGTTPQGNISAFSSTVSMRNGFTKSFSEHNIIIGIVSVRADLTYQQGLNKMFTRETRYDFYLPSLAHLGEQAVLNSELYLQDPSVDTGSTGIPDNDKVFGYQERWSEMRYKPSLITGQFRSSSALTLDAWHLSQDFSSLPLLSQTFIEETPPISRVVAVPSQPDFNLDCYISLRCARPMPLFSVPGMIDHF